jgi:hypothetical protein
MRKIILVGLVSTNLLTFTSATSAAPFFQKVQENRVVTLREELDEIFDPFPSGGDDKWLLM